MSDRRQLVHPLFDPTSAYSRMRKSLRPEYKMRGYLHWQKSRAIRLGLPLVQRQFRNEAEFEMYLLDLSGTVWRCASSANPPFDSSPALRVTDAFDVRPVCLIGDAGVESGKATLVLVHEADGSQTVGLCGQFEPKVGHSLCRAFLIETEVSRRLQEVVRKVSGVAVNDAIAHAFAAETVAKEMDVARLLSAIPDLDGELVEGKWRFQRLPIASTFESFPPRREPLTVVIVVEPTGGSPVVPREKKEPMGVENDPLP